jgi:two-component system nitrogen regulation sensor histidine kinase NtrY
MALALGLELIFLPFETDDLSEKLFFFLLINLNVLALLGLIYFVGKSLIGVFLEWKRRTLGYRFKTRVMALFLILTAIPLGLLFLVSSGLGTNYIDRFFAPQFRESIESSIEIAKSLYALQRRQVLQYAELARSGHELPPDYTVHFLDEPPDEASASVRAAFEGRHETEVISAEDGDIVRASIPMGPAAEREGVVVVEALIPTSITMNIERIKSSQENYLRLEAWKVPLKLNYLLLLGFFTMIIIFSALWVSLRVAGWITEPVKNLAAATEAVASGDLSVSVSSGRRDEMGLLIESFNTMVKDMRDDKESLLKAYQNMENIVKSITSGVISLDEKGMVQEINDAACSILNVREEDVMGKFYPEILASTKSSELTRLIKGIIIKDFTAVEKEVKATIADTKVMLRISIAGLKGPDGEHLGLLVVVDDLTDVIKAQRALAWQEVARRMTHEIKNPLTPIQLSTERMLKKWKKRDPEFDRIFERSTETIIREVNGLKRLVNEFSKMGRMPEIVKEPTDLKSVIQDAVNLYKDYKHLEIRVEDVNGLPTLALDGEQFKRAIINLIDNAREAMDNKGRVTIRINPVEKANKLYINIEDDGPGINEEDKEKLFLPYFSTKKHGTGLGLVIADRVIAEHGGSIRVRDNTPHGCVFVIELPIKEV